MGAALMVGKRVTDDALNQVAVYLVFFGTVPLITAWAIHRNRSDDDGLWAERVGRVLPPAILLCGLWGINRALYHADYEAIDAAGFGFSRPRFLAGLACTAGLLWLFRKLQAWARDRPMPSPGMRTFFRGTWVGLFILSLFNVDIGHDSLSYDPYTGPASAVALGAIPMVDVFSQYGLNFLVLTAGLKLLPWSMYSLSLVVTVLNLVYYLLVILICLRLGRDKTLSAAAAAFLTLFLISAALYNSAYTPSAGAMRYLPSLLLLWTFCHLRAGAAFSKWSMLALSLSSLWSMEALVFSAVTYGTYIGTISLGPRPIDGRLVMKRFLGAAGLLLLPYLVLSLVYHLVWGIAPRFDIYLQLVATQTTSSDWIVHVDPAIRTWVIFGFCYAMALAWAWFKSWQPAAGSDWPHNHHAIMAGTAALGIMQLSYYAGRGVTPVLVFIAFPLLIIFVVFIDSLFAPASAGGRRGSGGRIIAGLVTVALISCGGVIGDRFFRQPFVLRSNGVLLRHWLSWPPGGALPGPGLIPSLAEKLRQPVGFVVPGSGEVTNQNPSAWQLIPNSPTTDQDIAAYTLIRKWARDQREVFVFSPDSAYVLFALKKTNALGLTHPMVDDRSVLLREKALRAAERITAGTVVMVGYLAAGSIETAVWAHLQEHWLMEEVDESAGLKVYRLQSRK
ncbi:MAG: hypothetical protein EBY24_18665 [Betaproteobacteria bacterium]|nr:hypothetical protein [Betaproteobacteria bacterium]